MPPPVPCSPFEYSRVLRYCYHCRRPQDSTAQLKKCAGCRVVEYCSKECQKAAWPKHKPICVTTCKIPEEKPKTEAQEAILDYCGFKTPTDAAEALRVFLQAHRWAINVHSLTSLRRKQGFNPTAGDVEDWVFECTFQYLTTTPSGPTRKRSNPASTFRLVGERFIPIDEFKRLSRPRAAPLVQWSVPQRAATTDMYKNQPRFLGTYPVVHRVEPMGFCSVTYYAFYAPNPALLSLPEDERHRVLDDLNALAVASVNAGISLRAVEKASPLTALPGRFVRANKMWTWEPLFKDWEAYLAADPRPQWAALLDDAIASSKSGLPIARLVPWGHFI